MQTREFSIAPSAIAGMLAGRWLGRRWFYFALPVAVAMAASLTDVRWFVVALMLLFIVWPMALFFVWTGEALRPEAVRAAVPHRIVFEESGFVIEYTADADSGRVPPDSERYEWKAVRSIVFGKPYVRLELCSGTFVAVPYDALTAEEWGRIQSMGLRPPV